MTTRELARQLVEDESPENPAAQTFVDRLLLRLHHSPALMANLLDVNTGERDGNYIIELDFRAIPDDVIPSLLELCGSKHARVLKFNKNQMEHVGVELSLTPDDLKQKAPINGRQ